MLCVLICVVHTVHLTDVHFELMVYDVVGHINCRCLPTQDTTQHMIVRFISSSL